MRVTTIVLLVSALCCCSWQLATGVAKKRVRKELRRLSSNELAMYKKALRTMYTVSTEQGQTSYGPKYRDWEYFLLKHGAAAADPRPLTPGGPPNFFGTDQAHFSPALLTFHRAFLWEMEDAILSVVPELKAAPYWDITMDAPNGKFWGTQKAFTADKYNGPMDGKAKDNWQVTAGFNKYLPIKTFSFASGAVQPGMPNSTFTLGYLNNYIQGPQKLMRGTSWRNPNLALTRFPTYEMQPGGKTHEYFMATRLPGSNAAENFISGWVGDVAKQQTYGFNITAEDAASCLDLNIAQDWINWTLCVDFSTTPGFWPPPQWNYTGAVFKKHQLMHSIWHTALGGLSPIPQGWCNPPNATCLGGDAGDGEFSPNELFAFFLHHANLDRACMLWQIKAVQANPAMANNDTLWGYPAVKEDWPSGWPGIYRDDVISSNFPFYQIGSLPLIPTGYTHGDLLFHTNPLGDTIDYTYDTINQMMN